jgi:plastocyanin
MPEYWIQIENKPWEAAPKGVNRMGMPSYELTKPLGSTMFKPLGGPKGEALIFRRYTANWEQPDDRKVNPWDINEPDPAKTGGTIPGPTLECEFSESLIIHFRNKDLRKDKHALETSHSMHPHGITFHAAFDGAYPLSPPDPSQPIDDAEKDLWETVGVTRFKKGDRVPTGGTFTYRWNAHRWPSTAGVWLYHDHSWGDMEAVNAGAIGFLIIHNANDPDDIHIKDADTADLPGGSWRGSPILPGLTMFAEPVAISPLELDGLAGEVVHLPHHHVEAPPAKPAEKGQPEHRPAEIVDIPETLVLEPGTIGFHASHDLASLLGIFKPHYRKPPKRAQYLMLFHEVTGVGMCMNGRIFLGNTPTMLGGPDTAMRFGVVGMGDATHTFHLHGHRWTINGPEGTVPAGNIQNSPEIRAVSQFEDTRVFGAANSFGFTIHEGSSFMGAPPEPAPSNSKPGPLGEWHMHCHVLGHMMGGMMGSLLIVGGGEIAGRLPHGESGPPATTPAPTGTTHEVAITGFAFVPATLNIAMGDTVRWTNTEPAGGDPHTASADDGSWSSPTLAIGQKFSHTFATEMGDVDYHCNIHPGMKATIHVGM